MNNKKKAAEMLSCAKEMREKAAHIEKDAYHLLSKQDDNVPQVTITIKGPVASGKTTVAAYIYEQLDRLSVDGVKFFGYDSTHLRSKQVGILERLSRDLDKDNLSRRCNIVVIEKDEFEGSCSNDVNEDLQG